MNGMPGSDQAESTEESLHFLFCLSSFEVGVGPLQLDPMAAFFGRPLSELLTPVSTGAPTYAVKSGARMKCWPCALRPNQGLELKLPVLGECSLYNEGAVFRLTVPVLAGMVLTPLLTPYLRGVPEPRLTVGQMLLIYRFDIPAGSLLQMPLPDPYKLILERQ